MEERRAQHWARIAITIQFLALVRTLAEYYRIRYVQGLAFVPRAAEPYIAGGLLAAVCAWAAVTCYLFGRYRAAIGIGGLTIVLLLAFKWVAFA